MADVKHSIYICLFKYEPAAIEQVFQCAANLLISPWAAFPEPPFFCPDFLRTKLLRVLGGHARGCADLVVFSDGVSAGPPVGVQVFHFEFPLAVGSAMCLA